MEEKNFWLFAGADYYPGGGMRDFKGRFASEDEAIHNFYERRMKNSTDWGHILNTKTMEVQPIDIDD